MGRKAPYVSNNQSYFNCDLGEEYNVAAELEKEVEDSEQLTTTEKQTIIRARVGQGRYRKNLLDKYDSKCVVTGIDKPRLLVASHIKPWSVCDNKERVDTENGLILSPNMDRLFDSGLITFSDEGIMKVSSFVGNENAQRLHISNDVSVDLRATRRLLLYLEFHREVLFVR